MSKKIILTIMTLAIAFSGILGTSDKVSAAKKSTNKKSIDVIVGYKGYIRKVKVNGKITKLKYNKKYLKLTKKGNKIKFSKALKPGKTTVTVKCKGCKTSKITVRIWKDKYAWGYEFSRRWASNKKIIKKYSNVKNNNKYNKRFRKFNKCKKLIIKNYNAKEMAAAKKAAGKYVKVKFYKGNIDICCGNVVLLGNKKSGKDYARRIYNAIDYNNYSTTCEETKFYRGLINTLPGVKIISCIGMDYSSSDNIYSSPSINAICKNTNNDESNTDSDIDTETDDTNSNVDNIDDTDSNVDTNETDDETTNNIPTTTTKTTVEEDGTEFTTTVTTQIITK